MTLLVVAIAQYLIIPIGIGAGLLWVVSPPADKRWLAMTGTLAGVFGVILTKVAGGLYYDPRPFVVDHLQPLFLHAPDNGFPSDHTVVATIIGLTILQRSRALGIVLLLSGAAVGAARVIAKVHQPLDILAGVAIGSVAVACAVPLARRMLRSKG